MKKSIFSKLFLLCLFAIIGVGNASAKVLYCKCVQNWWKADGAAVGAHYWGGTGTNWPGKRMTSVTGQSDVWAIEIPDDNANIIFLRVNGTGDVANWGAQTNDLTIGTTNNFYTITSTSAQWSGDGKKVSGQWSKFQLESQASITPSASSVSVGEEVTFTPALTSNQEYNDVLSTTYSVGAGATITSGKFVATEAGTYTVTATVTYNAKGYTNITKTATASCSITVSAVAVPHPVTGVTIAPTSVTIKQGATATLTATVSPSNADDPSVTWSSDNTSVATVVNGVVTAVAAGTANITVTTVDGGFAATCAVKVKPSQYTFHAINSAQWPTVAAHYWGGADGGSSWPGADMVKESETINGFDIYSITISSDFTNIMFTNKIDGGDNKKTEDLTTEDNDGKYYDIKGAKWYASLSEVPVSYDYYVIGTINEWILEDANYGMKDDDKDGVYEKQITLAAGNHVIKVNDGTWSKEWQFSNLTATYVGVTEGTDDQGNKNGNIAIHLDTETTITVKLNPTRNELTLDGLAIDAPIPTYDYYVIGTINNWGLKDAAYGMTDDNADGVYEKEVTLAAGDNELKVNNGTWDDGCHWGFGNLSAKYEGVEEGKDGEGNPNGNIKITLATQQTIIVKYDKKTSEVTLDGLTESTAPTKYYVVGTFTDNWANAHADYELTLDEDVYKKSLTLNAGEHMFKITNGTWDDNATWGYGNITGSYVEIDEGTNNEGEKNGNIKVTLAAQKTFTVIFDATAGKITFEGLTVSTAPTKYYVKGSHNNWTADATSEMTLDEDVYKKEVTLAKDVEFKINDGADAWWGKDNLGGKSYNELEGLEGGNLKMKEAKTFTIIFNPAEDLITFDGLTEETPVVEDLSKQPSVIYIKCDDWKVDNARYAAYFYGTDETWVNMTDADKDGVYEVVNNKKNRHVIFCRMNPASNENKWDNCWNQSADLEIPTTTYLNYWTVTSTDDVWNKPLGKWMMLIGSGDNSEALAAANEQTVADVYVNRNFTANQLYTIALPFDLNVAPTKTHFGDDVKVIKFEKLNKETNGDLVLLFAEALGMAAGKPYVITPSVSVDGFVVNDVVIKNTVNNITQTTTGASVTMEAVLSASKNAKTNGKYWLASNTYLYNTSAALKSLRAVFDITTQSNMPPRVRIAQSENVETGLDNNQYPTSNIQKLIENGQLIIIREGVKYNVQGQVIR